MRRKCPGECGSQAESYQGGALPGRLASMESPKLRLLGSVCEHRRVHVSLCRQAMCPCTQIFLCRFYGTFGSYLS